LKCKVSNKTKNQNKLKKDAPMVHPFLFVTRFGETDNSYRLSWVKHKIKNAVKQEKSAFYRIFLLFIDVK